MRGVFWGIGFVRLSARAPDLEHEVFLCKTAMSVPSIAVPESWHKNAPDTLSLAPTRFFRDKMAGATGIEPVISYATPIANVHFYHHLRCRQTERARLRAALLPLLPTAKIGGRSPARRVSEYGEFSVELVARAPQWPASTHHLTTHDLTGRTRRA
jgi:hypothetical protein